MNYQDFVDRAKRELRKIEGHQARIAEMAVRVCTIRHGGVSKGFYTITQFAEDIGVNEKTLQNWVQTYRNVYTKIDVPAGESPSWKKAARVNNLLKEERTITNEIEGKPKSRFAFKQEVPKERINQLYHAEKPFEGEFFNISEQAKTIRGALENHSDDLNNMPMDKFQRIDASAKHINNTLGKRDLSIITDERLMYLMSVLDEASEKINTYLTNKRKNAGRMSA